MIMGEIPVTYEEAAAYWKNMEALEGRWVLSINSKQFPPNLQNPWTLNLKLKKKKMGTNKELLSKELNIRSLLLLFI
jgi:hypothetical protein